MSDFAYRASCPLPTDPAVAEVLPEGVDFTMEHYAAMHAPDPTEEIARKAGRADSDAGRTSRYQEYSGFARSAYIRGYSDATRAR